MERPRPSTLAWGAIGAGVLAYEVLCPKGETLSERLDSPLEKPMKRAAIMTAIGVTALHLSNMIPNPQKYDPFTRLTKLKKQPRL